MEFRITKTRSTKVDGPGEDLFSYYDWLPMRDHQEKMLCVQVDDIKEKTILETPMDDLCDQYEKEFRKNVPVLHEGQITVDGREVKFDVSKDRTRKIEDRNRPHYILGMIIEVKIPFSGDPGLFHVRPTTHSMIPPRGEVVDDKLVIRFSGTDLNPKRLRENIDKQIKEITKHLDRLRKDVHGFNERIRRLASERIELRRRRLQAGRDLVAALGFPLENATETTER